MRERAHLQRRALCDLAAGPAVQASNAGNEGVKVAVREEAQLPALIHVEQAAQV